MKFIKIVGERIGLFDSGKIVQGTLTVYDSEGNSSSHNIRGKEPPHVVPVQKANSVVFEQKYPTKPSVSIPIVKYKQKKKKKK